VLAQANGDDDRLAPVRDLLAELAESEDTAGPLAEAITAVGTRYPASGDPRHPWAGRMVPDISLGQDGDDSLTAPLTRSAGGALLLNGTGGSHALSAATRPWADRVTTAHTHPHALDRAHAILVRQDGHAAWIGAPSTPVDAAAEELRETLARWFGRPAAPVERASPRLASRGRSLLRPGCGRTRATATCTAAQLHPGPSETSVSVSPGP
jgi:hypothetical protein